MWDELSLLKSIESFIFEEDKKVISKGEDVAIIKINGSFYALTVDSSVENVHFDLSFMDYYDVGWRLACANLSDLASVGALPLYYLVSLTLPKNFNSSYFKEFYKGITDLMDKYNSKLIGGNISKGEIFSASLFLVGKFQGNKFMLRRNIKKGQKIYISGDLGEVSYILQKLKNKKKIDKKNKFFRPYPKIELSLELVKHGVDCAIDISDGFIIDLKRVLDLGKKFDAILYFDKIPAKWGLDNFFYSGEEYEILFFAFPKDLEGIGKKFEFYEVGEVVEGEGKIWLLKNGKKKEVNIKGWIHSF